MKVWLTGENAIFQPLGQRVIDAGYQLLTDDSNEDDRLQIDALINVEAGREYPEYAMRESRDVSVYWLCYGWSATRLAKESEWLHRGKVVGFSMIPPFTDSSVLEITRPLQTPIGELEKARSFFASLGFKVVEVPDGPGLVQARIVACLANEAISALSEGVADAKTIDTAMKLGTNYPRGPLEWAELISLPSILAIMEGLQSEYLEDRYRPHPLLKRLVAAGMSVAEYEAWKRGE
jgi:hypothetical protein